MSAKQDFCTDLYTQRYTTTSGMIHPFLLSDTLTFILIASDYLEGSQELEEDVENGRRTCLLWIVGSLDTVWSCDCILGVVMPLPQTYTGINNDISL